MSAALMGKNIQPVTELHAGDIGAVAKLKDTLTGDTLGDKARSSPIRTVQLPEPSIAYAISAKTRQDEDRLGHAIQKILEEDPVAALLPRPADQGISARGQRPAACGGDRAAG